MSDQTVGENERPRKKRDVSAEESRLLIKQRNAAAREAHLLAKPALDKLNAGRVLSIEQGKALRNWAAAEEARAIAQEIVLEELGFRLGRSTNA